VATTSKKFQFTLEANDVGQLLDGLRLRAESWAKTADYLDSGFNPDDTFICVECRDAHEARCIAQHYERIIHQLEAQIARQRD
jgi:hypothetical protein